MIEPLHSSESKPWTRNAIRCRFRRLRERLNDKLPDVTFPLTPTRVV